MARERDTLGAGAARPPAPGGWRDGPAPARWRRITLAARCLLAALLVGWLVTSGRLDLSTLARLRPDALLVALLVCRAIGSLLPMLRWRLLLAERGLVLPLGTALHIGLVGSFYNLFAPASIGLDAARLYYGARLASGRNGRLLVSVALDRGVGLLALLAIALVSAALFLPPLDPPLGRNLIVTLAGGLLLATAAAVASTWTGRLPLRRRLRSRGVVVSALDAPMPSPAAAPTGNRPAAVAVAFVLSLLGHASSITAAYVAFRLLETSVPFVFVCAVQPLVMLSAALPLTPMGLGVADTVADLLYRTLGAGTGAEAAVLLRIASLVLGLAAGVAFLVPVRSARSKASGSVRAANLPRGA